MNNKQQPISFIIPSQGNKITANDIKNKQIRITAVFKRFFPENDSEIKIAIKNDHYLRFKNRGKRSHIIRFTNLAYDELGVKVGGKIDVQRIAVGEFKMVGGE